MNAVHCFTLKMARCIYKHNILPASEEMRGAQYVVDVWDL